MKCTGARHCIGAVLVSHDPGARILPLSQYCPQLQKRTHLQHGGCEGLSKAAVNILSAASSLWHHNNACGNEVES